ncbi:PREDICTED: NAD kinase 2, mitochondrial [Nicrophorus vespilloides]|uniref:NAD kinase 2, mitochondrial n=1 Tax=Nicrophorus vespilloides TaxID=110193 RepID=A0ABM1MWD6_NICVS|nr:PREDICTED: NAD kinase 2, mitochondrial [Nicrophorus vespilloides]XP_017778886.1 PREDICTED: NAD kinase 2, mitochondrial [Nicrophorus vespilloides]
MYKQRLLLKNFVPGANGLLSAQFGSNAPNSLKIENALVVSKLSHFDFEKHRYKDLNEHELEHKIRNRGTDYDKLKYYHNLHKNFENNVVDTLKNMGIAVKVVNRFNYSEDSIHWADIIVPTGGDGTFLLAASKIRDNKKLVVGFNSDPNRSEGHLCLPKKYSTNIREAIEKLQCGDFKWLLRSRIRTTLIGQRGTKVMPKNLHECNDKDDMKFIPTKLEECGRVLPYLALNEVFIGESLSARVSHLSMWLNGFDRETNMKCSGVCICTGTGSTSWNLSINRLPIQSVAELLRLLDIDATEGKDSLATVLARMYNDNLTFAADDKKMCYTIRDLISAGVWPQPKGIKSRGFASKVKVKSNCFDACLVIDGGVSFEFNDGTIAILEINPDDALRTVTFSD